MCALFLLQLQINWRERSSQFGDALVQCAIELQIRQRLQAGIIRLINNQVHQQVQVDLDPVEEAPQHPALPAAVRVRTLKVSPLPNNATCDEVRTALLEANIRVTAVRPLDNRSCEVSVDSSPEVDLMIARGEFIFAVIPSVKDFLCFGLGYLCLQIEALKIHFLMGIKY